MICEVCRGLIGDRNEQMEADFRSGMTLDEIGIKFSFMANREKRLAKLQVHVPPSLKAQLDLFLEEEPKVLSMSDYLYGVIEEHAVMRIAKQKIGRKVGNQ